MTRLCYILCTLGGRATSTRNIIHREMVQLKFIAGQIKTSCARTKPPCCRRLYGSSRNAQNGEVKNILDTKSISMTFYSYSCELSPRDIISLFICCSQVSWFDWQEYDFILMRILLYLKVPSENRTWQI
jgi:hypothetical protein